MKPIKYALKQLLLHDEIAILTGAGVSKASGIPTFRGDNGVYSTPINFRNKDYDPSEFITYSFFKREPEALWNWLHSFAEVVKKSLPN